MANAKKGNKESLAQENNEDMKPVLINFKGEKTVYEFKNVILSGLMSTTESDEISTIISGYNDIDDFVTVFNNIILQAYDFLQKNADNSKEEILGALRETVEMIFEGIEADSFDDFFSSSISIDGETVLSVE